MIRLPPVRSPPPLTTTTQCTFTVRLVSSGHSTFELMSGKGKKSTGGRPDSLEGTRKGPGGIRVRNSPSSSTRGSSEDTGVVDVRAIGGGSKRPLMSSVQARKEAERVFPTTSKSGRPEQHNTVSQQIFMSDPRRAAEVAEQVARDKEYARRMREMKSGVGKDKRFFGVFTDYRQIQDTDPYASVFGESTQTERLRTAAWQRQFEKENENVELPYERTNVIARLAPNWFVRYFINMRDSGGSDNVYGLVAVFLAGITGVLLVYHLFYTTPKNAKPINEVR